MTRVTSDPLLARALTMSRRVLTGVFDLAFPPLCLLCKQELAGEGLRVCEPCREKLSVEPHPTCPRCALTIGPFTENKAGCLTCAHQDFRFDAAFRLGRYEGLLQSAILQIKHPLAEDLADDLGHILAGRFQWHPGAERIDAVVPVPLHWLSLLQRGYNQAGALARSIACDLKLPLRSRWLSRRRHTAHQAGQSVTARRENMHGAFTAASRPAMRGKTILLIDDVMTTGSTCSEAARALKQAGAGRVIVAVLARAELA